MFVFIVTDKNQKMEKYKLSYRLNDAGARKKT
jgi:hypothetical protein